MQVDSLLQGSQYAKCIHHLCEVYLPSCSLVEGLFSPQQGSNHFPILSSNCTLSKSLSFYIFPHLGCQFHFVPWNWLEYLRAKLKQTVILQSEISQSGLGAAVGNQDVSQPHAKHITQSIYLCTWCPWAKRTKPWTQKTKLWTQKTHSEELTLLATQTNSLSFETTWWMKLIWQILYAYITGIYF